MTVNEIIKKRKSVRKYEEGGVVTEEQVKTMLEAAMLAPSACNSRPWEFTVIRNRDVLNEIAEKHAHAKMMETASLAILVCADKNLQSGVSEGFYPQDCGAAVQNILLQAAEFDLGTCWCGIYPKEEKVEIFKEMFNLPENIVPFAVISVGVSAQGFGARGHFEESKVKFID